MPLLLANVGNRNLLYDGQPIPEHLRAHAPNQTFKAFTRHLLDDYAAHAPRLAVNILNALIDEKRGELSEVVLFASNQTSEAYQDQDTLYAGELLARKITEAYGLPARCVELRCGVTNNEQLMRTYRSKYKEILREHPDERFLLCDAGGTAQQKAAFKIMAEYLFDTDAYEVFYVAWKGGRSVVEPVPTVEYRRIIGLEQIDALNRRGNYRGAADLYALNRKKPDKSVAYRLMQFAHYRRALVPDAARHHANPDTYKQHDWEGLLPLHDYHARRPLGGSPELSRWVGPKAYFDLCETLAVADHYHRLRDLTGAVLYAAIFTERYLAAVLTEQLGYDLLKDYDEAAEQMVRDHRDHPAVREVFGEDVRRGLPLQIVVAGTLDHPDHTRVLATIREGNSWFLDGTRRGIDRLRNDYAHRGLGVDEARLAEYAPDFAATLRTWREALAMPETSVYDQLNDLIKERL
ncbi:MAG: hypothetical protein WBA12_09410 [Catalinimonas sp.]